MPAETQIGLARLAIEGYLPIFEKKWPAIDWPRKLLEDIEQWVSQSGRRLPDEPDDPDPADAAFISSLDYVLVASSYSSDPGALTSGCASAVNSAISARQSNVWIADDLEAVEMWKTQQYFPGHGVAENVAAIAVAEREWNGMEWNGMEWKIAEWIEERQAGGISEGPEGIDQDEIEKALARWKEQEMLPVTPKS